MRTPCSSTGITKILSAFTAHGATAMASFHPVFTLRALFELGSLDKINEFLVINIDAIVDPVFSASHTSMILTSAFQTIVLFAYWTFVIV